MKESRSTVLTSFSQSMPPGSATYLSTGIYDWMSFRAGTLEIPMREIFGPVSSATGPGRH